MKIMTICLLWMSSLTCFPKKNLILKFIMMIKPKVCLLWVDWLKMGIQAKKKSRSKSRGRNSKFCHYCKKIGHEISECYKLKNKNEREQKGNKPQKTIAEASIIENESGGDILLVTSSEKRSKTEWILDSGCTYHISPYRNWFTVDCGIVLMGNDSQCKVVGIGSMQIETHDYCIMTVNVHHIHDLK